ncbi:MAG: ATPase, partial [Nitrospiraceae bacterium]
QIANVFACRSERVSIFRLGFLSNPFILWGIAVELILLALLVYTPFGNWILGTKPLPWWVWFPLVIGACGLLLSEELRKRVIAWIGAQGEGSDSRSGSGSIALRDRV